MAKIVKKYYKGLDLYSDGEIEDKIFEVIKNDQFENVDMYNNWVLMYHLSHLRENILNWYDFKEGANILEVGSGCGSITGMLADRAKKVISVELSNRRASINYERNSKYDNVEIYIGNIFDMSFECKFDYIIFNGVFEYSARFIKSETPFNDMINFISKYLNCNGELLIAIENRMGLKYFSGAKEDHIGKYFYGINGYSNRDPAVTFSKNEIDYILKESGYKNINFLYPFPDYKFPEIIVSEEWLTKNDIFYKLNSFDSSRYMFFDEIKIQNKISKELMSAYFSNSFLITAKKSLDSISDEKILYIKISSNRQKKFRIYTKIYSYNGKLIVKKIALNKSSTQVIFNMKEFYESFKSDSINLIESVFSEDNNYCKYSFIDKINFENTLMHNLRISKENFLEILDTYFNILINNNVSKKVSEFNNKNFTDIFGLIDSKLELYCSNINNLDMNFDNIFLINGKITVIDYEWVFNFDIPGEFIFWRGVKTFFEKNMEFEYLFNDTMKRYNLSDDKVDIFKLWELSFSNSYVKQINMDKYSKSVKSIYESENIVQSGKFKICNLYIDTGNGFNDLQRIENNVCIGDKNELFFNLSSYTLIKALRFDPIELSYCAFNIKKIIIDGRSVNFKTLNSIYTDLYGWDYFLTKDPIYMLDIPSDRINNVKIEFNIRSIDFEILEFVFQSIIEEKNNVNILYSNLDNKLKELIFSNNEQLLDKDKQLLDKDKIIINKEKELLSEFNKNIILLENNSKMKNQIELQNNIIDDLNSKIELKNNDLIKLENEINMINTNKFLKLFNKIKNILKK